MDKPSPLAGRNVVITGAGQGIGAAYAAAAAALGAGVVVNDIDFVRAREVAAELVAQGHNAVANGADVTSWQAAEELIDQCVRAYGTIDALVNNAAVYELATLDEVSPDSLRRTLEVNVCGSVFCAAHAVRRMGPGSSIINVTSAAQTGIYAMTAYGASKGAVASLTYTWAAELQGRRIRVNAISPTGHTRMSEHRISYYGARDIMLQKKVDGIPPASNAPLVCYLISTESDGINGQVFRMKGEDLELMSHPAIIEPVLHAPDWTFDDIARAFTDNLRGRQAPLGLSRIDAPPGEAARLDVRRT